MNEKLNELLINREFAEKLLTLQTLEEVKSYFYENCVEVTESEIEELREMFSSMAGEIKKLPKEEQEKIKNLTNKEIEQLKNIDETKLEAIVGGTTGDSRNAMLIGGGIGALIGLGTGVTTAIHVAKSNKKNTGLGVFVACCLVVGGAGIGAGTARDIRSYMLG